MNVTVPVGVPPPLLTVAVKVTACPKLDGLISDVTLVVVFALFTTNELLIPLSDPAEFVAVIVIPNPAVESDTLCVRWPLKKEPETDGEAVPLLAVRFTVPVKLVSTL